MTNKTEPTVLISRPGNKRDRARFEALTPANQQIVRACVEKVKAHKGLTLSQAWSWSLDYVQAQVGKPPGKNYMRLRVYVSSLFQIWARERAIALFKLHDYDLDRAWSTAIAEAEKLYEQTRRNRAIGFSWELMPGEKTPKTVTNWQLPDPELDPKEDLPPAMPRVEQRMDNQTNGDILWPGARWGARPAEGEPGGWNWMELSGSTKIHPPVEMDFADLSRAASDLFAHDSKRESLMRLRDDIILTLVGKGMGISEVAQYAHLTPPAVHKILAKYGVKRTEATEATTAPEKEQS